jgi:hypothetical protein
MEMTQARNVVAHLKGLCIPVLDLLNGRHTAHVVGELIKFLGSMGQSDREFFYSCQGNMMEVDVRIKVPRAWKRSTYRARTD